MVVRCAAVCAVVVVTFALVTTRTDATAASLYEDAPFVETNFESAMDFEAKVLADDSKVWVVSVYTSSPECEACAMIAEPVIAASEELAASLGVKVAAIDVDSSDAVGFKIGKKIGATRLPAVVGFGSATSINPYTKKPTRDVIAAPLSETFSANDLKRWVANKVLPGDVIRRGADAVSDAVSNRDVIPAAVLVTERSQTGALAKSLGVTLRGRLALVEVAASDADAARKWLGPSEDDRGPVSTRLVAVDAQTGAPGEAYAGSLKDRAEVLTWLEKFALAERRPTTGKADDDASRENGATRDDGTHPENNTGPFGPAYVPPTIASAVEFETLVLSDAAAFVIAPADAEVDSASDVGRKLLELDGSGAVKAAACAGPADGAEEETTSFAPCFDDELGGENNKWLAYGFSPSSQQSKQQQKKPLLGAFETAAEALSAAAKSVPDDAVDRLSAPDELEAFVARAVSSATVGGEADSDDPDDAKAPVGFVVFSLKDDVSIGVKAFARLAREAAGARVAQYMMSDPATDPTAQAVLTRFQIHRAPAVMAVHAAVLDTPTPPGERPPNGVQVGLAHYDKRMFGPPSFRGLALFAQTLFRETKPAALRRLEDAILDERVNAARRPRGQRADDDAAFVDESSASSSSSQEGGQTPGRQQKKRRVAKPGVLADLNVEGLDAACGPDSGHQLCAVVLLDRYGDRAASFETELAVARDVARSEASAPFAFGWLDAQCHLDQALALDVDPSKLPTLVAYAPKKQRAALYVGHFNAKDLRAFLRGVLSGRIQTAPLRAPLADVDVARDCETAVRGATRAATQAGDAADDEADAAGLDDDLMAEILAEEAAAKQALEDEAKAEVERLAEEARAEAAASSKQKSTAKKTSSKKKKKKTKKNPNSEL